MSFLGTDRMPIHAKITAATSIRTADTSRILAAAGCGRTPSTARDAFVAMSVPIQVTLVGVAPDSARAAFAAVRAEVERLEATLSDYRPESNVARLNRRESDALAPETRRSPP